MSHDSANPRAVDGGSSDEAMLTWLAGDQYVVRAASQVWHASGTLAEAVAQLRAARRELKTATRAYTVAITACRIPPEHVKRLGAALILRLARTHHLTRLQYPATPHDCDRPGPDQSQPLP